MIRAIAIAIALLTAAPAFAVDLIDTHSETPSFESAAKDTAKPKRKPIKADTSDYLVVTLKEASITSY